MFDFNADSTVTLQQKLTTTGVFTGVALGYARYDYDVSSVKFSVRARVLGSEGNNLKIQLVNPGVATPQTTATYDTAAKRVLVNLKHSGSAITATATEVVNAINRRMIGCCDYLPMIAAVVADGTVGALASTSLAGGIDPNIDEGGFVKLTSAAGNGGLFYFEQKRPWYLRAISGRFEGASGTLSVRVAIVNVDKALNWSYLNEDITLYAVGLTAAENYQFTVTADALGVIMPGQAILVVASEQGTIRCSARVEAVRSAV